jgi:hypothetical protein
MLDGLLRLTSALLAVEAEENGRRSRTRSVSSLTLRLRLPIDLGL